VTKTSTAKISPTEQSIQTQGPIFFPVDVTNEKQIQDMFNKVKQDYGRLDAVLNCAGIGVAFRTYNINKVRLTINSKSCFTTFFFYLAFNAWS
jgi:NAD(P)-dependent dehydrogenase (short-subunit alcohol dehydrogenase family)